MTISQDKSKNQVVIEDDRTGLDTATIKRAISDHLVYLQGKTPRSPIIWFIFRVRHRKGQLLTITIWLWLMQCAID